MAATQPSPQVLHEFVQNLLDDLVSGRITPDAAMVASQQYPYLRTLMDEHKDEIAAVLQDEGRLRVVLEGALRTAASLVKKELPQFRVEKPDAPLSPNDIVAQARAFGRARSEVFAAIRGQRTFIHRLIQNWITQTKSLIDKENRQQLAAALQSELERGLLDSPSPDEITARVGEGAGAFRHELVLATQKLAGLTALSKEVVGHLSTPRPDRFTTIAIQTISSTTLSPAVALARAASLARTAGALSLSLPKEKDVTSAGVFFRAFASTPVQKAFAVAADALLHQLSPLARQEVIKATFSRALEGALVKTDLLTERLGREFVESELFKLVVDSARKEFARGADGSAGARQARGALEDIIGSVLRGPIAKPLVGSPKEAILSYFELLAIESRLPHDKKMVFPDRAPVVRALSLLSGSLTDDVRTNVIKDAGFASSTALRNSASQLAQRLPSWQMFYIIMLASGTPLTYASFIAPMLSPTGDTVSGIVPSAAYGSVGGGPAGALSGGLGAALGWVGRGLSGVAFGLGGGFVGMIFGGGLGSLFNRFRGAREPDHFFDDTPKFLAVTIVFIIVLLFIFPSFLNTPLTGRAAKYAALLVRSQPENQPEAFFDDGQIYPSPDYINLANLGRLECLNTATAGIRGSVPFGKNEQTALKKTLDEHKELSLLSCPLKARCEGGGINLSRYTAQSADNPDWLGFAPSKNPGNIMLYPGAFATTYLSARVLAHELMHQVQYFRKDIFSKYAGGGDCGFVDIYHAGEETIEERFAEAGAMYLMGNPAIKSLCGGKTFEFYQSMFSQCQ